MNKVTSYLPTRSLIFIGICALGILGFLLLVIYPNHVAENALDEKALEVRMKVEEQKALSPIYKRLRQIQRDSKETDSLKLDLKRRKGPSEPVDIDRTRSHLENLARDNRLVAEQIEPDVATILDDSGRLKIAVSVTGRYGAFREFMVEMTDQLPSLESIESLQIQRVPNTRDHRLTLIIWLAQG